MYDLRGHGRSPMPASGYNLSAMAGDLCGVLDRFGVGQANIVGHSFGARVALTFAAQHPDRVRNLVVADTQLRALQAPMRLREWPHWSRWRAELLSRGLQHPPSDDSVMDYRLLAELSRTSDIANLRVPVQQRIALRSRQMGTRGAQRWQQLLQHTTAPREFEDESLLDRAGLAAIAVPTLLLFGELSHCLSTAYGLLELLPDARLMMIPGAGHFFPLLKPRYFERAVNSFLNRSDRTSAGVKRRRAVDARPAHRGGRRPECTPA
jgi:pimeloyl-ACP methyl ester carboxylesterase